MQHISRGPLPKPDGVQAEVSIVVTCKGRLRHLMRTLPSMLAQDYPLPYEILIVDYGCPEGTYDWCVGLDLQQVICVFVGDGTDEFNRSRAHNIGGKCATGHLLAFVDADIRLDFSWLSQATASLADPKAGLTIIDHHHGRPERFGTCVVSSRVFHEVRGYDEAFVGWGYEDKDFYMRCKRIAKAKSFDGCLLEPILHSNRMRLEFHALQSRKESKEINQALSESRAELPDDREFGCGELKVSQGRQSKIFGNANEAVEYLDWCNLPSNLCKRN